MRIALRVVVGVLLVLLFPLTPVGTDLARAGENLDLVVDEDDPDFVLDLEPIEPLDGGRPSSTAGMGCDAVAGNWQWGNRNVFALTRDGRWTITNGNGSGTWHCQVNSNGESEVVIGPDDKNWWTKAVVAADGMSMSGVTETGDPVSAARLQSCGGVVGSWRWGNGNIFALTGDGRWTITNGNGNGTWRCQVNSNGENEVVISPDDKSWWTKAVVAADGMSMSGVTETGDPVSAARALP